MCFTVAYTTIIACTQEERESFTCLLERGFVDAWRRQHPGITGYTYWNYRTLARSRNSGWRLDYFLVQPIDSNV